MTRAEKEKLATLVGGLLDITDIIHPDSAISLGVRISNSTDDEVLDILIGHLHNIKIYAIYQRFDKEASVRDINNLLEIIHQLEGGKGS